MSSIVTLAEHGIGFCILCNKICVKLSGKHQNKNLTNKQGCMHLQHGRGQLNLWNLPM